MRIEDGADLKALAIAELKNLVSELNSSDPVSVIETATWLVSPECQLYLTLAGLENADFWNVICAAPSFCNKTKEEVKQYVNYARLNFYFAIDEMCRLTKGEQSSFALPDKSIDGDIFIGWLKKYLSQENIKGIQVSQHDDIVEIKRND